MKDNMNLAAKPIDYEKFALDRRHQEGQISLFPTSVAKSRGGVADSVFRRQMQARQEVDDVCERNGQDLPIQSRVLIEYSKIQVYSSLRGNLNGFDWEVMDAIATLYSEPGAIIYLDSIYRVIVGKKSTYSVTEKQRYMVNESIEKMRHMSIEIKILDFFEKGSPISAALLAQGIRTGTIRNYLIPCEIQEYQNQTNKYVYGIRLLDAPPLFLYAKTLGLASIFPLDLINTPLSKTRGTIVLQSFLLRTIDQMYRDRECGNEYTTLIEANAIYAAAGDVEDSDTEKGRNRKKTEQLLTFWTNAEYIAGYTVVTQQRNTIRGYRVELSQQSRFWNFPDTDVIALPAQDMA